MQPSLECNANTCRVQGEWTADYARQSLAAAAALESLPASVVLNGEKLERLDTTGTWLLVRTLKGKQVQLAGFTPEQEALLQDALHYHPEEETEEDGDSLIGTAGKLYVGGVSALIYRFEDALSFGGEFLIKLGRSLMQPTRFRFRSIVAQAQRVGVMASPLIALISFLIAIVLAYQGSTQLSRFGADIYTVDLVAISVLREMGVLLTAIMVAGRSGSAFAAEIGVMKLNEEIDALKTTGLDPAEVLIIPRILALVLMMPVLTVLADLSGLFGAGVLSSLRGTMSPLLYMGRLHDAVSLKHFWVGMIKAPVFGLLIGCVGCYHGMRVSNSAESVGTETTSSVVHAIFLVILADAAFSIVFTQLNI